MMDFEEITLICCFFASFCLACVCKKVSCILKLVPASQQSAGACTDCYFLGIPFLYCTGRVTVTLAGTNKSFCAILAWKFLSMIASK